MDYDELTEKVFDAYYASDRNYPTNLFYPIVTQGKEGAICDRFINCIVRRDSDSKIIEVIGPIEICQYNALSDKIEFLDPTAEAEDDIVINRSFDDVAVAISDFAELYMKLRDFAFQNTILEEQRIIVDKLLQFYELLCDKEIKEIYHRYGRSFFEWAVNVLD